MIFFLSIFDFLDKIVYNYIIDIFEYIRLFELVRIKSINYFFIL